MTMPEILDTSPRSLLGREAELAAVADFLDGGAAPSSGAGLLVRGPAGIGRSALLAAAGADARARGMRVLTVTGTRLEAGLPLAGLHQLIQPFVGQLGDLPVARRDTLLTAFGMATSSNTDLSAVALATHDLITEGTKPVLVLADDVQWLDTASSTVLAMIGGSLRPGPMLLVAAVRSGYRTPLAHVGLREVSLGPLGTVAARALVDSTAPWLSETEREQVLVNAGGNPLTLTELPDVLCGHTAALRGIWPLPPLPPRLAQAFATADHALPATVRTILLIAAANDRDDLAEVIRTAAALGIQDLSPEEALAPAVTAGLVRLTGSAIGFPHSLARAVSYWEASPTERAAAHAALAEILSGQPERRAWHVAMASGSPDETVARQMEGAASHALRHGGLADALAAQQHAVQLTSDPRRRGPRLLLAAELARDLGQAEAAREMAARARRRWLPGADRMRLEWFEQAVTPVGPSDEAEVRRRIGLAQEAIGCGHYDLALRILGTSAFQCLWTGYDEEMRELIVAAVAAVPERDGTPQAMLALVLADPVGRGASTAAAVSRVRRGAQQDAGHSLPVMDMAAAGLAAVVVGDAEAGLWFLDRAVPVMRAQGRQRHLARALVAKSLAATYLADLEAAIPAAVEGIRLAEETGQPQLVPLGLYPLVTAAVLREGSGDVGTLIARAEREVLPVRARYGLALMRRARGIAALTAARYDEAFDHLCRIFDPADPAGHHAQHCWAIADLAEAAAYGGFRERARPYLNQVIGLTSESAPPLLRAHVTYACLLTGETSAESFQAAIDGELANWPFLRARALLAYGYWLRRDRRILESRTPLRESAAAFDELGFTPWVQRARQELSATGERATAAPVGPRELLTPQDLRIAELAASGMSNREIGQRLSLSHRTVAGHLYSIFPKLGIGSRFQLPQALDSYGH